MFIDTKHGLVYEPENEVLNGLYKVIEKHAPVLDGSPLFADLVAAYEALQIDLKEENKDGKAAKIA